MVVRRRPSPSCDFFFVCAARSKESGLFVVLQNEKKIRLCARVCARQEEERCGVPSLHNPSALAALAFLDHT